MSELDPDVVAQLARRREHLIRLLLLLLVYELQSSLQLARLLFLSQLVELVMKTLRRQVRHRYFCRLLARLLPGERACSVAAFTGSL